MFLRLPCQLCIISTTSISLLFQPLIISSILKLRHGRVSKRRLQSLLSSTTRRGYTLPLHLLIYSSYQACLTMRIAHLWCKVQSLMQYILICIHHCHFMNLALSFTVAYQSTLECHHPSC